MVCLTEKGQDEKYHWKICMTDEAVMPAITWFHEVLSHPGRTGLFDAMHLYYHPNLRKLIDSFRCNACQRHKVNERGWGHMSARDIRTLLGASRRGSDRAVENYNKYK